MNQSQLNDLYEKLVEDSVPPPQTEEERNIEASMLKPDREPVDEEAAIEALRQGKVLTVWNHPHDGKLRIFRPACFGIIKPQPAKGKEHSGSPEDLRPPAP